MLRVDVPLGTPYAGAAANDPSRTRNTQTADVIDVEAVSIQAGQSTQTRRPGQAPQNAAATTEARRINNETEVYTDNTASEALPRPLMQEFSYAPTKGILGAVTVKSESPPLGQILHVST